VYDCSEPSAPRWQYKFVPAHEFAADLFNHVTRNGKTESAVHTINQRVHSDHFPVKVAQRTAAVPRINRGIGLQVIRDRITAGLKQFAAAFAADYAVGECVIELERRADSKRKLAHAHFVAVAQLDDRQIFCVNFDDGDVRLFVSAYDSRRILSAIL